jgi:peptidyl-prolyl cis-trans isomerase B (cyclophilin B)
MTVTRRASSARLVALISLAAVLATACSSNSLPTIPPGGASPSADAFASPSAHPSPTAPASESPAASPTPPPSSAIAGCPTSQPDPLPTGETRTVTIETSKGTIVIEVDGSLSPIAAGNFVALAECGWYTGVVFHRLVPGFVIQGGDGEFGRVPNVDPARVGTGGPGYTIKDEPVTATYGRGTVAMARTQMPDSQGSQFFIVLDDVARAPLESANTYAIFGTVTSGMEAVDAIAAMPNSGQDTGNAALEPVPMDTVTVTNP